MGEIDVESLSVFERLEILRLEVKARKEELIETEREIRGILLKAQKRKFLAGISKYYSHLPAPEGFEKLDSLEQKRVLLTDLVSKIEAMLPGVQKEAESTPVGLAARGGPGRPSGSGRPAKPASPRPFPLPRPSPPGSAKRGRRGSFEDF